jgi:integrase-like protein
MTELLLDAAGRLRSPATMAGFHADRPPRNKGHRYPADPPTVVEMVAVMRTAGEGRHGRRLRGLIVVLWRAGLRIHEALALNEPDLDHRRGSLLVRRGKGGRRREVSMDEWAWEHLQPWIDIRVDLPVGPLFCVINGQRADGRGHPRRHALICAAWRPEPACADGSHLISFATRMPSKWLTKGCRSSSSNGNRATATSASPRSTSKASTTPRSSRLCMLATRPRFRPAPRSGFEHDGARASREAISASVGGGIRRASPGWGVRAGAGFPL